MTELRERWPVRKRIFPLRLWYGNPKTGKRSYRLCAPPSFDATRRPPAMVLLRIPQTPNRLDRFQPSSELNLGSQGCVRGNFEQCSERTGRLFHHRRTLRGLRKVSGQIAYLWEASRKQVCCLLVESRAIRAVRPCVKAGRREKSRITF